MKQEQPRTFWCWLGRTSQIGFAMVLPVVVCTVAASWLLKSVKANKRIEKKTY